jgi:prophage DNA circulation protein
MGSIRDIHIPWRDDLLPASYGNAMFHVATASKENGRRIVLHQFPKREQPYAEDMGRKAIEFSVRGYCITFMQDTDVPLYRRDYRIARDILQGQLETGGDHILQLPTLDPMRVVCPSWRLTEEERFGGYCVFDMQFQEFGRPPFKPNQDSRELLNNMSTQMKQRVLQVLDGL